MKSTKVIWRQVASTEKVQCGDMWSSHNPNTPEKQTGSADYNLQMQAVWASYHGKPMSDLSHNPGSVWRPVGIETVEVVMA